MGPGERHCHSRLLPDFSATAWFTGTALRKSMDKDRRVPLGLIRSSAGGTKIRLWSSADAIAKCVQSAPPPKDPSTLFENMIRPLSRLDFRAVVWYQERSICIVFSRFDSLP